MRSFTPIALAALLASAVIGLSACGGSDDPAATETKLSGSIIKGPVKGSKVTILTADGKELASTTTNDDGSYSVTVAYNGDVVIEAKGGTYTDEATKQPATLNQLKAIAALKGGEHKMVLTPLTYLGYTVAVGNGGIKSDGYAKAMAAIATQFKLNQEQLAATPNVADVGNNAYGQVLRAVSQYIASQGGTFTLEQLIGEFSDKAKFAGTAAAFSAAYKTVNSIDITYSFDGKAWEIGGTGTGTGTGSGAAGSLTINTNVSGIAAPAVTVANVPKPASQADFCGALQNDSTFQGLNQSGGSLTIKSCSFSGNVGNVSAEVRLTSPISMTVPYSVVYTYN